MTFPTEGFSKEEKEEIKKFLQDCKDAELIKFSNPELQNIFQRSQQNAEIDSLAQHALLRVNNVREKMKLDEKEKFIPQNEFRALQIISSVSQLQTNTEELKIFLKAIMDPEKINQDVSMLGAYVKLIYDKLDYSREQRNRMNELLNVELRNALNHNDYELRLDGFSFTKKNGETKNLSVEGLLNLMIKNSEIHEIINDLVNQLKKEQGLT